MAKQIFSRNKDCFILTHIHSFSKFEIKKIKNFLFINYIKEILQNKRKNLVFLYKRTITKMYIYFYF